MNKKQDYECVSFKDALKNFGALMKSMFVFWKCPECTGKNKWFGSTKV